jgi:hypothetical protein
LKIHFVEINQQVQLVIQLAIERNNFIVYLLQEFFRLLYFVLSQHIDQSLIKISLQSLQFLVDFQSQLDDGRQFFG